MTDKHEQVAVELHTAELDRVRSETKRNEAERARIEFEGDLLRTQSDRKWYQGRFIVEGMIGGVVAAGLLAAWFVGFFQPLLLSENELAKLENTRLSVENQLQKTKNEQVTLALKLKNETVARQLAQLKTQNSNLAAAQESSAEIAKSLQERLTSLQAEYASLSEAKSLSDEERARFAKLARSSEAEVVSVRGEVARLRTSKSATIVRAAEVRAQQLVGDWYGVWDGGKNSKPYRFSVDEAGRLSGTYLHDPDAVLSDFKVDGDSFGFRLIEGERNMSFDLSLVDLNRMKGKVTEAGRAEPVPYELLREGSD